MHIEAQKLFCDIIRFHSFFDSAQTHSVSLPAASQTVQALEERLGLPLTILRHRGAPGNPAVTRFIELLRKPNNVPSAV